MFALFGFSEDGDGYPMAHLLRVGANRNQLVVDQFGDKPKAEILGFNGWYDEPVFVCLNATEGRKFMVVSLDDAGDSFCLSNPYFFQV